MDVYTWIIVAIVLGGIFGVWSCIKIIRNGYREEELKHQPQEIIVLQPEMPLQYEKTPEVLETIAHDIKSYDHYREMKIQDCVERVHMRIINELTVEAVNTLWIGLRPEDMHYAIRTAVDSFGEAFNEEVVKEIVIEMNERVEQHRYDNKPKGLSS